MANDQDQPHQWLIFQDDKLIIKRDKGISLPGNLERQALQHDLTREHLLGEFNGIKIYCAEITTITILDITYDAIPFREALNVLGDDWFTVVSKAFTIINWDRNHQFCGRCGHPTTHNQTLFDRECTHCHLHFYPRISPSIIVLIQKGDELLMARSPHFSKGVYGLIAGFVEAGESVEEAVHREVYEETQLRVKNLRYFGSQTWPFPDSLMIGFFADYDSGDLIIDPTEIEEAGWYHYNNLPGRPNSKVSIASNMLDHYLKQQQG